MSDDREDILNTIPPASSGLPAEDNQARQSDAAPMAAGFGFIDEKQLLARLPVSRRTLFNWRRAGKIPWVRLGGRKILFHWPSIEAALLRHQCNCKNDSCQ